MLLLTDLFAAFSINCSIEKIQIAHNWEDAVARSSYPPALYEVFFSGKFWKKVHFHKNMSHLLEIPRPEKRNTGKFMELLVGHP